MQSIQCRNLFRCHRRVLPRRRTRIQAVKDLFNKIMNSST
ncbi:hypothetical protein [Sansalvadorimonas verongulae]